MIQNQKKFKNKCQLQLSNPFSTNFVFKFYFYFMAGIYLHIPFCKQACHYCDFHFSTKLQGKADFVKALTQEITLTQNYLGNESIKTIYFGGGTPSILSLGELENIFEALNENYSLSEVQEITIEVNPDDVDAEMLIGYKKLGINRLSIGIQSFDDGHLKFTNRNHQSSQAIKCVKDAQDAGFDNISIDLIYGIPSPSHAVWEKDLATALALEVQHISAYCLTIEPQTVFGKWKAKNKMTFATDDFEAAQFEILLENLSAGGFEQYEISNFCINEKYALHNTNYWLGEHYLGLGPSAHSFNGQERRWNVSNNNKYTAAITNGNLSFDKEQLTERDKANEYIMIGLRTKWGLNLGILAEKYFTPISKIEKYLLVLEKKGLIVIENNIVYLTQQGKLLGDEVSAELFI